MITSKRGSVTLIITLVASILFLATATYFITEDSNSLTAAASLGIQKAVGPCNYTINEDIINLGHDYECVDSDGFDFGDDDLTLDCMGHKIICQNQTKCHAQNFSGVTINQHSGIKIKNCIFINWSEAIEIDNASSNNATENHFLGNKYNVFIHNTSFGADSSQYNRIWNNNFTTYNYSGYDDGQNFWELEPNCNFTNIIGGPCLGGNYWDQYHHNDVTGDGLGDTPYPVLGGAGEADNHPLVAPDGLCPGSNGTGQGVWSVSTTLIEDFHAKETGECFALIGNNLVLDCGGHSITGVNGGNDDERGIEIMGKDNVTIQNCVISNFTYGIWIRDATNITLINNTLHDNEHSGIYISDFSQEIIIANNTIMDNISDAVSGNQSYGIYMKSVRPTPNKGLVTIISNSIYNHNTHGIYLTDSSDYNTISSNNIYNNTGSGIVINNSDANTIINNEVHNNSNHGIYINPSTGIDLGSTSSARNTVYGNGQVGMYIKDSAVDTDIQIVSYDNYIGLQIEGANDLTLGYLNLSGNSDTGLYLKDSNDITLDSANAYIYENNISGVVFSNTNNSLLMGSSVGASVLEIHNNTRYNLFFINSDYNSLHFANIYGGQWGITLTGSSYNNISFNTVANFTNLTAVPPGCLNFYLDSNSNYNLIFNNYIDNATGCIPANDSGTNYWNTSRSTTFVNDYIDEETNNIVNGDYFGGNYWTAYSGQDVDGDGLGDTQTPYNGSLITTGGDYQPLIAANISCGPISNSITLTGNLSISGAACLQVQSDRITIDCQNYYIVGSGTHSGIDIQNKEDITVKNCNIRNFSKGIYIYNSTEINLTSNTANNNSFGISIARGSNTTLTSNTANNNSLGIVLQLNSSNITLTSNTANNNVWGLALSFSNYNFLTSNTANNNNHSIYLENSSYNVFTSNTAHNSVSNQSGIYLNESKYNNFTSNSIKENSPGIELVDNSHNNTFTENIIQDNTAGGIDLSSSNDNHIYNNFFHNTINAVDTGTNIWNTTYNCTSGSNIVGGACIGGNLWGGVTGYLGEDNGNATLAGLPNVTDDGVGDTIIPYNNSNNINNGGDYLPLFPKCGNLSNDIILSQNLSVNGTCFRVLNNDITIDCNGYALLGNGSASAIYISNKTGITVKNCHFENFQYGIYADPSTGNNFNNNNITSTTYGIYMLQINQSEISNNRLYSNNYGLYLTNSDNNTLLSNFLYSNTLRGAYLLNSTNNRIYNNNFTNTNNAYSNEFNYWNTSLQNGTSIIGGDQLGGNFWSDYLGVEITGDTIGDTRIPYNNSIVGGDYLPLTNNTGAVGACQEIINQDAILTQDWSCAGTAFIITGDDLTFDCQNHSISGDGTGSGILISGRKNIIIKNCEITDFYYGIRIENSANIQLNNSNYIHLNDFYGIYQFNSTNTKVIGNEIINDNNGVYSISSQNTFIKDNIIDLQKKFYGIYAYGSTGNTIIDNNMTDNYHGIYLVNSGTTNATNNNITETDVYSIFVHKSTSNSDFINNFLSNGQQAIRIKNGSNTNTFLNNTIQDHTLYGIYSTDSASNSFTNNTFTNNSKNVYLSGSTSNTFTNNDITNSATGVQAVSNSNSLTLHLNTISSTVSPAVQINDSTSVILTNNTVSNNAEFNTAASATLSYNTITDDLNLTNSDYLTINNNDLKYVYTNTSTGSTISSNTLKTLYLLSFESGTISSNEVDNYAGTSFHFQSVDSSNIYNNDIQDTTLAIFLNNSNNNNLYKNWLKDNSFSLNITSSTGNTIYNNYFRDIQVNEKTVADDSGNTWNISNTCGTPNIVGGPCLGGNFYSDYHGLDNGAEGREQGDGIGDEPSYYEIAAGNRDTEPLVLYVARQYYHPDLDPAKSMIATGNYSGQLNDSQVVPNTVQLINYTSSGRAYLEILGLFNQSDVDADTLKIDFNENKTTINKSKVTGIKSTYDVFLYHDYSFDAGVYFCPNIYNLSQANSTCANRINFTTLGTVSGITLSQSGAYYKISNISNTSSVAVLNKDDACGSNILHDVTFTSDLECNTTGAALTVLTDNITIDFAGHTLSGNNSGIGLNISNKTSITVKNAKIRNFSTALYADPSYSLNLINNNFTNSNFGVHFYQVNNSHLTNNRFLNNNLGLNLSDSYNNTIYNNYFNNTINARDDGSNIWNITFNTTTNIIGESAQGGNFWSDYTGWDADPDAIGDTKYYNITNSTGQTTGTDYLPLVEYGYITCGDVTTNVTLVKNLTTTTTANCFNITADDITFDCQNNLLVGNDTGYAFHLNTHQGVIISNCIISDFDRGINLDTGSNNTILSNQISSSDYGIYLLSSSNNSIISNTLHNNTERSLYLSSSHQNNLTSNMVDNNSYGIYLFQSSLNDLVSNTANLNTNYGIYLQSFCDNNTITSNTASNNVVIGIRVQNSDNNTIYNNFFSNTNNSVDDGTNFWNTSLQNGTNILGENTKLGGNYWSNYNGQDTDVDGIGDTETPYNNSNNIQNGGDYLPLVYATPLSNGASCTADAQCSSGHCNNGYCCNSGTCCISDTNCTGSDICSSNQCTTPSSGTSGSSSGGGGGGGGGGGRLPQCNDHFDNDNDGLIDYPEDYGCENLADNNEADGDIVCQQSWICRDWSECTNNKQTRTCYDQNDCLGKDDVTTVDYIPKPDTSRDCLVEVTTPPSTTPEEEEPFLPPVLTEPSPTRTLLFSSAAVLFLFGSFFIYFEFIHAPARLRRKLKKTERLLPEETIELLKQQYQGIYALYLKISHHKKTKYYSNIMNLREKIEAQIKAEKEIEKLFHQTPKLADLKKQKANYLKITKLYDKLPAKTQEQYYQKILHLRETLEKKS